MCRSNTVERGRSNVVERGGKTWKIRDIKPAEGKIVSETRNKVYSDIPAGYALLDDGTLLRLFPMWYYTTENRLRGT